MTSVRPSSKDPLCCCEYENADGERSHILQCCCDCLALDEAFDRCLTCNSVSSSTMQRVVETLSDRCRIPWIDGKGAVKAKLDIVVPIVAIPLALMFATISVAATVATFICLPLFMLTFYRIWRRLGNRQTSFFYVWALTSVIFSYFVFISFVIPFREILLWENLILFSSFALMFYMLFKVKKNPGRLLTVVRRRPDLLANSDFVHGDSDSAEEGRRDSKKYGGQGSEFSMSYDTPTLAEKDVKWIDSRPIRGGKLVTWCDSCNFKRPPRSGHCTICESCITIRDHHCVWVNNCIGANNHRSFLAAMLLFIFCGSYGSHLTLTTICTPEMYYDWLLLPNDCRFLYANFDTAISVVTVCYTLIAVTIMSVGLLYQVVLISQNTTSQELHQASMRGMVWMGLFAFNNVHNHGIVANWAEFLFHHSRKTSGHIAL
ncbi:palmitoyltransferase ZDHHC23-like [Gigantopelta aegis]|uniref:palmitoyltransferase ZDHHC23-like n=1 Tax=Gigantopelta aegis TaxID=1735272 RepID=UPI001B888A36|nr:palmitoyltransferase ZDHHC23-like [Gigantopelta aegis]XP_041373296.1 palmitoyltransferase ZDHHC23-like [Gigantopelta aegis]